MVALLIQIAWVQAEDFIQVKGMVWDSALSGNIKASTKSLIGTKLDLRNDLGVERYQRLPEVELKLNLPGMNKIIGTYWNVTYEGKKNLTEPINYQGISYSSGEYLKTELDLEMQSLLYERLFLPESLTRAFPALGEAEVGVLLGVKYLQAESRLSSALSGTKKEDAALPIPVGGLFMQVDLLQKLRIELGVTGISCDTANYHVRFIDGYGEVRFKLIKFLPLGIGYQVTGLNIEKEKGGDFSINLSMKGYYFFTTIEF